MKRITVLIVDDEPAARRGLRKHAAKIPDVEVVGECRNGREAVDAIRESRPDIVFLDIQMPGLDGFGVVEEIGVSQMPVTVFVTAFDHYALRAFDAHALDYILKPVDPERFEVCFERAKTLLYSDRFDALELGLQDLLDAREEKVRLPDRLVVRDGGRVLFVPLEEICCIQSAGNYVKIQTGNNEYLLRQTMGGILTELSTDVFLRISRSHIVNVHKIAECQVLPKGRYRVLLTGGRWLHSSRNYREAVEERLGL